MYLRLSQLKVRLKKNKLPSFSFNSLGVNFKTFSEARSNWATVERLGFPQAPLFSSLAPGVSSWNKFLEMSFTLLAPINSLTGVGTLNPDTVSPVVEFTPPPSRIQLGAF